MLDEKNALLNEEELDSVVGGMGMENREKECDGCKAKFSTVALSEVKGKYYCPKCLSNADGSTQASIKSLDKIFMC